MTPTAILKQYFGYDQFREGQLELINALTHSRDVLGIMPTGAGKSLCYQVPALLLPGVTLVISPLISLMRDQVQSLVANGIKAAFINSSLTESQMNRAMEYARAGQYQIIYIAPERLLAASMSELTQVLPISLIAVDEAHCISQWGQDFRPSYLDIPTFVNALPTRPPIAAFTATATPRVREDILGTLKLSKPLTLVTGFDRPNLYFGVKQPKDKYSALLQYIKDSDGSGIVYCSTRKDVDSVTEKLVADGFSAARYHAGLSDRERSQSQDDFLYDRVRIMIATNAFGMGIDKSDVRFVVHYNMPQNVESYYQEAGRAGRDGLPGDCILFYARKDISTALFLINKSGNHREIQINRQLLKQIEQYCETDGCLRRYILHYFGETIIDDCGNCGNCVGNIDETDVTTDVKKVLSHITRLNRAGKQFMFTHTADILLGKSSEFTDLPTFGIMKSVPRRYVRQLINRLTALGYIRDDLYLSVTPEAKEVLFGQATVTIRGDKPEASSREDRERKKALQNAEPTFALSKELFAKLKELRLQIAREENIPAFIVFSDATLMDMCHKHPHTIEEFLSVSGVGYVKLERYGERFLQALRLEKRNTAPTQKPPKVTAELFYTEIDFSDTPVQISRIADMVNVALLKYGKPKTSGMKLNRLLMEAGYLEMIDGVKHPTDTGRTIGITTIWRNASHGAYMQCLFGADAQRICIELLIGAAQ